MKLPSSAWPLLFLVPSGCADEAPREPRGGIALSVAPLTLPGAADVCYGIYVQNGSGDLVTYIPHVCSSRYGNGAGGDISYVAPCDAQRLPDAANADNVVTLVLEGVDLDATAATEWLDETQYRNPCGWPDPAGEGAALATAGALALPLDTVGYSGPGADAAINWDGFRCQRVVPCEENADVAVTFNLTVMRDADQGFFDIAVNFEDIFCSAKVDCAYPATQGSPARPILLVHDPATGARVQSVVWAFACTDGDPAGADTTSATHLYLDDLELECGTDTYAIPPSGGPGNLYPGAGTPPAPLVQAMVFEGREQITNGGLDADKLYWSVALGLRHDFFAPAVGTAPACTLRTRATASKGPLPGGVTPVDTNYPVIDVSVVINDGASIVCTQHGLDDTGEHAGVATDYTGALPDGSGFARESFDHVGAPTGGGIATNPIVIPVDPCSPNPCLNGGICAPNGAAAACTCSGDWSGPTCDQPTPLHNTVTCGFATPTLNGGCAYGGTDTYGYDYVGDLTWKECMLAATRCGATIASQGANVTPIDGWNTHRIGDDAMYAYYTPFASDFRQLHIGATRPCILGRDQDATTNNVALTDSTTYDGDVWIYQDLGQLHYDECSLAASNAGASMITPATIGLGTGDGYWVHSVYARDSYQSVSDGGTAWLNTYSGACGVRPAARACMIGYMERGPATLAEVCSGGVDEDGDGAIDCADPDCREEAPCLGDVHRSIAFVGGATAVTNSGALVRPSFRYDDLGAMTWRACMLAASERGAMVSGIREIGSTPWNTHRVGGNAMVQTWSTMTTQPIGDSRLCIVGRDSDALTDLRPVPSTVVFEGDTWAYEDLGTLRYHECQFAAAERGASIITPATIGLGTGVGYHLPRVDSAGFFYVSGTGASYVYELLTFQGQLSSSAPCMVGYIFATP